VERNARAITALLPLLLTTSACIVSLGKLGEEETDTNDDGASDTSASADGADGATDGSDDGMVDPTPTQRAVDILFVVDNSGSMGEEQANLVNSIDTLVATLETASPPVDYRIGVTTTDNGNPWCGTTGPEAGQLRATSCRSRPTEFVFNGATTIDSTQEACLDVCPLETLGIDDGAPWIDVKRSLGTTNVGDAVVDNLRCMLPQGIDGCGFESHLESLRKSVLRFGTEGDPSFGFHREGALLAVVIVSDEVDCSYNIDNEDAESIFTPEGNRAFWSDPMSPSPSSAVCWNAGVSCTDAGGGDLDCVAEDYDVDGNPTVDPAQAVLYPVERYTDQLVAAGAYVFAIYGLATDGSVVYRASASDPEFQDDFGIGPGCATPNGTAVPPVRIRELVTTLGGNEASICADGYQNAFNTFSLGILARLP
jgi:hypothetical protein